MEGGNFPAAAPSAPSKRRHYAANQSQAYYGAPEPTSFGDAAYGGVGGGPGMGQQPPQQLFTPGLAADNQFSAQQQQQPSYFAPGQGDPQYINGPQAQYGQQPQPPYVGQQPQVGQLADQFGQMGIGGPAGAFGQKPVIVTDLIYIIYLGEVPTVCIPYNKLDGCTTRST